MSQNWAQTVLDIQVAYSEDLPPGPPGARGRRPRHVGGRRVQGQDHRGARGLGHPVAGRRRGDGARRAQDRAARAVGYRPRDARADQGPVRPRGHRDPLPPARRVAPRRGQSGPGRHRRPPTSVSRPRRPQATAGRRSPRGTGTALVARAAAARREATPVGASGQGGVQRDGRAGRAFETGQFCFAPSAAAWKSSALMPSTVPTTVMWTPVMPSRAGSHVGLGVERGRRASRPWQSARQRHGEARRVRRGDQLLGARLAVGLLGAGGPGDVVRAEARGLHRDLAGPLGRGPSQWVAAVRVVAMRAPSVDGRGSRASRCPGGAAIT